MVWIHAINESAAAEFGEDILNPMGPDKFRTLGRRLRLTTGHHVLDIGAGRCGPALVLVREFGCRVTAVEPHAIFLDAARARVAEAGLGDRFEFVQSTGADFRVEPDAYDVAMCIGAEWAFGGLDGTIRALSPAVRPGGHVVLGTGYNRSGQSWQDAAEFDRPLASVIDTFEGDGLAVVTLIRATQDDFDTYASIHATSLLDWLEEHPGDSDSGDVERWRTDAVADFGSVPFGWAVIAARKTRARRR